MTEIPQPSMDNSTNNLKKINTLYKNQINSNYLTI